MPIDSPEIQRVVNPEPVSYAEGREDEFWLVDMNELEIYQSRFELRLVTPHAYWYVEDGQRVQQSALERAAAAFERVIYPRVTAYFGQEWTPGVDNDPHLNIVHGDIRGVAGYFSSADEHPVSVYPRSNQREIIYINSNILRVGSDYYLGVLAHELQHAVHWNYDTSEDSWVNEGLSELAVSVAGGSPSSINRFMRFPTVSLVHWPTNHANIISHYGGASLFMHYLAEHYGGEEDLRLLLTEPADSIAGIDAYLAKAGYDATFHDLFQDWIVANFLDEDRGLHGYADLQVLVRPSRVMNEFAELERVVPQYGADYIEIAPGLIDQPLRFRFEGEAENTLLPTNVTESGCWWSNAGDSIVSSLSRSVDLRGLVEATLTYQVWHSVEEEWDYGYVQVSDNQGRHWDILETPNTSPANPIGIGFGPGYTGESGGWLNETVDLTAYAGKEIMLRFQYVTDDATHGIGFCLQQIEILEAGILADAMGWQPTGFILTDNRVRQRYIVRIIQKGEANRVTAITLAPDGSGALVGEVVVDQYPGLKRLVVAVAGMAPGTMQKAPYRLTVEPAS